MILVLNLCLMTLNTAFFSLLILIFALVKLVVPITAIRKKITLLCDLFLWCWASVVHWLLCKTTKTKFEIQGEIKLNKKSWYLLIANHQSWADIVIVYSVFRNHIPMAKFFLKQQLLYVPFLGIACWALDMPFMRRYSQPYLMKYPQKRQKDLASTQKACEKFKLNPTTLVNFVEGTRFSEQKRAEKPTFEYLLPPKSGGIAYALGAMGEQFDAIIDLTIAYPNNRKNTFIDLLGNKVRKVAINVDFLAMNESFKGDYLSDKSCKQNYQAWLIERWQRKDKILSDIYSA